MQIVKSTSSITSGDGVKSTVLEDIMLNVFKDSIFLGAVGNTPIPSKYTFKPYTKVPAIGDTVFVIGGLTLTKVPLTSQATLTDETVEDSAVQISAALQGSLESQIRLELESNIITSLKAAIAPTAVAGTTVFEAAKDLLQALSPEVVSMKGELILAISHGSYIDLVVSAPSQHKALSNFVTFAPTAALSDTDVVLMHTHGAAVGYSLRAVEVERSAGSQTNLYLAQGFVGSDFATEYVARVEL